MLYEIDVEGNDIASFDVADEVLRANLEVFLQVQASGRLDDAYKLIFRTFKYQP